MEARHGEYPPWPYVPPRLTEDGAGPVRPHPLDPLWESGAVQHDYLGNGYPGPCVASFRDGIFIGWQPTLTIERAERLAA